jgi:hypothetical protein
MSDLQTTGFSDSIDKSSSACRGPYLFLLGVFAIGILSGGVLWDHIQLPFSNPDGIVGHLTQTKFNPGNNILRFMVFIILPALLLGLISLFYDKILWSPSTEFTPKAPQRQSEEHDNLISVVATIGVVIFAAGMFLRFFAHDFEPTPIDLFHDGEGLTPAYNWIVTKGVWTRSLIVHGAFYDLFETVLGWRYFEVISVGAARICWMFFDHMTPLAALFLFLCCFFTIRRSHGFLAATSLLLTLQVVYAALPLYSWLPWQDLGHTGLHHTLEPLGQRDITYLLGLGILITAAVSRRKSLFFIAGLMFPISFFYSIDRGVYFAVITCLALFLVTAKSFWENKGITSTNAGMICQVILWVILGWAMGWILLWKAMGTNEMRAMIENLLYWIRNKELIDGLVYPNPLAWDTEPAVFRVAPLLTAMLCFFTVYRIRYFTNLKNFAISCFWCLFLASAVMYYRWALGRSDMVHAYLAGGFILFATGIMLWICFINSNLFSRLSLSNRFGWSLGAAVLLLGFAGLLVPLSSYRAMMDAPRRISILAHSEDSSFISPNDMELYAYMKQLVDRGNRVYIYTSAPAWYFLLRRASPTEYFSTWQASPISSQRKIVATLEGSPPDFILWGSLKWFNSIDGVPNYVRAPLIESWINKNYEMLVNLNGWTIIKLRKKTD